MNITRQELIDTINSVGAPFTRYETDVAFVPHSLNSLAKWFFVRNEPESDVTKIVREALLELDNTGMIKFSK